MANKKGIIERHDFISDLILEEKTSSKEDLLDMLGKNGFYISIHTLEKDLKHLNIGYSAEKKCYLFRNEQDQKMISEKKLKTILMNAGLKNDSDYKIYSPMIFCASYKIDAVVPTSEKKSKQRLLLEKPCIYNVLITCKIGYEQSVFNVINEKIITNRFISAQINIGSINFLFNNNISVKKFYKRLNSILSPKKEGKTGIKNK